MIKIIVSIILIFAAAFIYIRLARPLMINLKNIKNTAVFLSNKINHYRNQIIALKAIKSAHIYLKNQKVSTYMFTMLSFVNYLNSKGFKINIKLNKKANLYSKFPKYTVKITAAGGFREYETDTKFAGVKKIAVTMAFNGHAGITGVLSVLNKLYILFPISFANFKINKKNTVINFNLYSFKGV